MLNINYAERAARMTDAELAATVAVLQGEQQRRAAVPADQRPDPKISKMLRERHEKLYGNHLG